MNPSPDPQQMDWSKLRHWQVWDPVPWWILDRERLQEILVVQLDFRIESMHRELEQMQKIREIVAR
jgi:hypothetical protein